MSRAASMLALLLAAPVVLADEKTEIAAAHAACAVPPDAVDPAMLERPTALKEGIGKVSQKVTAKTPQVQAFYDQGLAYLHSYVWIEAARSFHQALREDPDCAMAWMGLARAEQGLNRDPESQAAIGKAKALESKVSERERRHIELRALQIDAQLAPPEKEAEKHDAYKRGIERAIAKDPSDAELWILRGNAEEPGPWGRGQAGGIGAIAFYEAALTRSPGHFGAHHDLVHAYENVGRHADAAEHGKIYADAAPRVAHAQHMYGHVLPRLGRWKEALEQFEKADAIEESYAREEKLRPGDDWHHVHNLQLLGYTYLRLGRPDDAEKAFRRGFETPIRYAQYGWQHATLAEYLLLRGRPIEALAAARALADRTRAAKAAGAAVEGEILFALDRKTEAAAAAKRARAAFEDAKKNAGYESRWIDRFVEPFVRQVEAELAMTEKSSEKTLLKLADELAANPRFDAWGEGLFRLERIVEQAKRSGRDALARDIEERMRRIDPHYAPGSTARPLPAMAAADGRDLNRPGSDPD
jgi:tetratricopeptide (TPR) repeat protein